MDLGITNELYLKVSYELPNIDIRLTGLNISISSMEERESANKRNYVHHQFNKLHSLNYFVYLIEIYNEIRYATISAGCCRVLSKTMNTNKEELGELVFRFKFYVDSAIYRYYSFWEIVGRFFNEYFDLQLDVNPKNYDKEKGFYFGREVIDRIIRDYEHEMLVELLIYWEKSKDIFDYRIAKTHAKNTRIGENILKLTKERKPNGRTLKFDIGKEYSINDLELLLHDTHEYALCAYISETKI